MYKVKVRGEKSNLDTCFLWISVGQIYHEGEKLSAAIKWINQNFKECWINFADTLQRYGFMSLYNFDEIEAHDLSVRLGDEWLERNQIILDQLSIPYQVYRWDQQLESKEFLDTFGQFRNLFSSSRIFRHTIEHDAQTFVERQKNKGEVRPEILHRVYNFTLQYLLEELAADTVMSRKQPGVIIYPNSDHDVYRLLREGRIEGAPRGLETSQYQHISFVRRKNGDIQQPAQDNQLIRTA